MPISGPNRRRFAIKFWWAAASLALLVEVGLMWQRSRSTTLAASSVPQERLERTQSTESSRDTLGSAHRTAVRTTSPPSKLVAQAKPLCGDASALIAQPTSSTARENCGQRLLHGESLRLSVLGQQPSLILVIGSASSSAGDELSVTLRIEPDEACGAIEDNRRGTYSSFEADCRAVDLVETTRLANCPATPPSSQLANRAGLTSCLPNSDRSRRVFFMHSRRGQLDDPASHLALDCQLVARSPSVNVFKETSPHDEERLGGLIAEVMHLAEDVIGPAIRSLVGPVRDVDGDGRLSVVLTTQLGRLEGTFAGVDGLTRASDFHDGVPRPFGNSADVLFLNANLPPGEQLRAVLAHEWGHAAVFGRRYGPSGSPDDHARRQAVTEEDWLNEGLAHLIEVQSSGSMSNLADRIEQFLASPETAPLIVRDYSRSEYWRHHGCRGATYLFLDWCRQHSGPEFVERLIDGEESGIANLQSATGRSWEDLFHAWTVSLGSSLASDLKSPKHKPQCREWHPAKQDSREITLRLQGSTAAFVRLTLDGTAKNWTLAADAPSGCQLQFTAIATE